MSSVTRKPPRQARASAKRALILRSAEALLESHAPAALTTRAVSEHAQIPIGSVYRYFANVDDLLGALFDDLNAETLASIRRLPSMAGSWREEVAEIIAVVEGMHRAHPIYGALMMHLPPQDEASDTIIAALTDRLAKSGGGVDLPTAQRVAATVVAIINGIERRYHALPPEKREGVFAEGARALTAYLATYLDRNPEDPLPISDRS